VLGFVLVPINSARGVGYLSLTLLVGAIASVKSQPPPLPPATALHYGAFTLKLGSSGAMTLEAQGWPSLSGTWKAVQDQLTVSTSGAPDCAGEGRYRFRVEGTHLLLTLIEDPCETRRMVLHDSTWLPEGEKAVTPGRRIVRTATDGSPTLPAVAPGSGSWPSFRGPSASGVADGQQLPDR